MSHSPTRTRLRTRELIIRHKEGEKRSRTKSTVTESLRKGLLGLIFSRGRLTRVSEDEEEKVPRTVSNINVCAYTSK